MVDSTIGQKLKIRRAELKLSLRALADQTGLSAVFLSQIERGVSNPSLNSLQKIATSLRVPLHYFLTSTPESTFNRSQQNNQKKMLSKGRLQ